MSTNRFREGGEDERVKGFIKRGEGGWVTSVEKG